MRMRLRSAAIALTLIAGVAAAGRGDAGSVAPASSGPDAPRAPRLLGPLSADARLAVSVNLRLRQASLLRFLSSVYDPASPSYHRFLSPSAFGARFGISSGGIATVEGWLSREGLRVSGTYPQRTSLEVKGTAADIERAFGVSLNRYRDPSGRVFHAPTSGAVVPADLAPMVAGVTGLSDRAVGTALDIPPDGLKPIDLAKAYDFEALWNQGIHGEGQTVAVFSMASFDDSDPAGFAGAFGISGPAPQHVPVNGGSSDTRSEGAIEVNLDVDTIRAVAPAAQVLDYEINQNDFPQALATVVNQVLQEGKAKILSISYGDCDTGSTLPASEKQGAEQALQAAAAAGISVFVSSGDGGAYTCQQRAPGPSDIDVTPSWPGDSPWVISVGGTFLSVRNDGSYLDEAAWGNPLSRWGTGGGLNPSDTRPSWQQGPGVQNGASTGKRQFPDVAASADSATGYQIYFGGGLHRVGGTSGSCPFWAGTLALLQEYVSSHGGGPLGFLAPALYRLASSSQPFPPFHDVTKGNNLFFPATAGWDYATGLGSPDVYNLARDLVAGR